MTRVSDSWMSLCMQWPMRNFYTINPFCLPFSKRNWKQMFFIYKSYFIFLPISGFKHDLYLRSPCRSCYWNYHWKVDFLKKKNKDNNTYGKIHASKSKQKINKIRIFEFEFEMKKIQNPCSLYQNVKELRKKEKNPKSTRLLSSTYWKKKTTYPPFTLCV